MVKSYPQIITDHDDICFLTKRSLGNILTCPNVKQLMEGRVRRFEGVQFPVSNWENWDYGETQILSWLDLIIYELLL